MILKSASMLWYMAFMHVYQALWTPTVGKALATQREHGNPEDAYAVAVTKFTTLVPIFMFLTGG